MSSDKFGCRGSPNVLHAALWPVARPCPTADWRCPESLETFGRKFRRGQRPAPSAIAWSCALVCLWIALFLMCLFPSLVSAQVTHGPPRIRNVYIPADQLQLLFDSPSKGVLMPRDKILALWEGAQRHVQSQTVPPADAVLTHATYEAQLDRHELRVTGRIQIAKLRRDWQAVDLPFGGLAVESAQIGHQPARFGRKDDGTLFLVLEQEGRFALELAMSAPLASKGGDLATTLKLPPVPAAEILVRLDEGKQLQLGETTLVSESTDRGQQLFRVAVDSSGLVPLVISDRSAGGNRSPLVFVNSRLMGHIEPAGLRWEAILDLDVYARATDTFRLQLPDSVDVAEVESPELARWTIGEQAGGTATVTLTFRKPVLGRRAVRLLGLAAAPLAKQWDVPTVKVPEAASHVGQVSLTSSPSLRVEVGTLAGIRPDVGWDAVPTARVGWDSVPTNKADWESGPSRSGQSPNLHSASKLRVAEFPRIRGADEGGAVAVNARILGNSATLPGLVFAFWDENFRLPIRVIARRGTVQASVATLVEVNRSGLALRSSVTAEPRQAPMFGVQVQLPRDWEVTSVLSGDKPVPWESLAKAGSEPAAEALLQTVRFDLEKPLNPGQSLGIALTAQRHPDEWLKQDEKFSELPLPEVRLADADEVEGTVLVQAPPDIEVLVSDLSDDLQPVAAGPSPSASAPTPGAALQYRYQDNARVSGRLQVRTKPAKVSAETLAFVRLDRGKLDVHYQLDLHIRQGTLRQIRFALPAAVGEKIQIVPVDSAARVIEQQHSPVPNAGDPGAGMYLWQIVLDRPVTGDLTLALDFGQTFSAPAASDGAIAPRGHSAAGQSVSAEPDAPVTVPVLALQNVSRQSGMVAVEAAGDQQIDCEPENLRDLDPADLARPRAYVPKQRIVAAYQYPRLPYRLKLSATRHTSESVLTAICESAAILTIAGQQGRMRHQARFSLRSLNLQHVPVTLPPSADLWSVLLDGQPVEVRRQQGTYLVPLPAGQTDSASQSRDLTMVYETDSPGLTPAGFWGRMWPQTIRQRAPEIAVPTLSTAWSVHAPAGTDWVSTGGDFTPETPPTRPTLVSRLAEAVARESTSSLPWKFGGLIAAGIIAGFFALIRTSKGCGITLVELLVVIAVILVLIALMLPAVQSAREAARRTQCNNNLKNIALGLQNYHETYKQFPPAVIGPSNVARERQFSWMVAILPFMEQRNLYDKLRLDLPWDDPHNLALLRPTFIPDFLACPSDPGPRLTPEGFVKTSYVAITGSKVALRSSTRGIIGFDRGLRMDEITDGTSNTAIVGEVTDGGAWFAGGAGTARPIDDWIEKDIKSPHPGGALFAMADGSVQYISRTTEPLMLRRLAIAQDGQNVSLDGGIQAPPATRPAAGTEVAPPETTAEPTPPEKKEEAEGLKPPIAPPQQKPSPDVSPQLHAARGERARLSLRVGPETGGEEPLRFQREGGPGELVIGLQDRTFAGTLQWLIVAAALLAAWIGRRASGPRRGIALVLALALPIGLSGLVPLAWTPLLDGLLLGALAAGGLWILLRVIAALKVSVRGAAAAALAIGISLLSAADASLAGEAPASGDTPAATAKDDPRDLTLYVPYDPEKDKPLQNTQVYLPHDEFLRLWRQAHPEEPEHAPPGVRAIVSHAEYSGQLRNDVARFAARLVIHHFADDWSRIVLPLGKVALEKIEINGRPATLAGEDAVGRIANPSGTDSQSVPRLAAPGDQPAIYLDKFGPCVVDVQFSVPVSRLGATGQMTVPLRGVSSGRLLFQLPAKDLDVQVGGCPGGWRRQTLDSGDAVSIPLGAAGELSIRWQPRRVEAREGQLVSVDQALLVDVLDSGVHLHSKFQYRVQQGSLRELQLRIPPDVAVQSVQGDEVADWSIETDPAAGAKPATQRLMVSLKTDLTTGTDVDIQAYRRDRQVTGTIEIHSLEPLGVVRETGRVAIGCSTHFRVRVAQTERMDQIDRMGLDVPSRLGLLGLCPDQAGPVGTESQPTKATAVGMESQPTRDGCALLSAYRYTARPWRLQLEIERYQPRVEVSARTAVVVTARQTNLRSLLTAQVTEAPTASFSLRLPSSLRVSQVRVPPDAEWFLDRDNQGQRLKVELSKPALGKLDLGVSGALVRDSDQAEFAVPGVTMEEVQTQRGQLAIYLDDDLDAVLARAGGARPIDPATLDRALRLDGNRPAHYAFQYDSPPQDLRLRLSPAPSRLNADVTTVVSVREGAVAYISEVDFEIRQAGRLRFQVVTPEWLGDDLELQGAQIRQIRSQVDGQRRTWDIELQQPVRGTYCLHLTQTLPLPEDGTVSAAIIRPLDVERSRSHVVLENVTADEIAASTISGAAPIAIAEVPGILADNVRRQAVVAYRITDDAADLLWQRRVRQHEAGLKASINLADLTTVVHADGRYRACAAYNLRNFTLQFLEMQLPPNSEVWSVHVSGQPVRPAKIQRQGRPVTLLPLQKTSAGDFSSKIVVVYAGHLGEKLHAWTQVRPLAPEILREVPVSRTLWTVFLPREYSVSLMKGESNLDEVAAAYQLEERKLSFLDELREVVQVAGSKGKSAARTKARENLKEIGSALQDFAQQTAPDDVKNAADVQEQARQIEAEIKRIEELKADAKRVEADPAYYFKKPPRGPEGTPFGADLDRGLEALPELDKTEVDKAAPNDQGKRPPEQVDGRPEERRGGLRKQAAEQLSRLQTMQQDEAGGQKKAAPTAPPPEKPPQMPEGKPQAGPVGARPAADEEPGKQPPSAPPSGGQPAIGTPAAAAGTGRLSLDLDVAPAGTAHHFRKLHGQPRLVLRARHENLVRYLSAGIWAGLCLALAVAVIQVLRRPNAAALASRGWPWLATVAGTAWLFLLPAGVFGLALLVTALCTLIARLRNATRSPPEAAEKPVG